MANLPFDNANFNLTNFANIYPDIMDSTPKTIEYQYKDANGNIQTNSIANRGEIKQQLWDDVGGALGQFNRTFYIDAVNGDDNNTGTGNAPFKTLKKAVDSVPIGGYAVITLLNDVDLFENISCSNKKIVVSLNGYKFNAKIDSTSAIKHIYLDSGFFIFNGTGQIVLPDSSDGDGTNKNNHPGIFLTGYGGSSFRGIALIYNVEVVLNDTVYKIIDLHNYTACSFTMNGSVTDNTNNSQTEKDLVSGIVKDANGVPRNIVSNIVF